VGRKWLGKVKWEPREFVIGVAVSCVGVYDKGRAGVRVL
jgi:hypothetical protein